MIRLPREEISYKNLYKNLDLDKDLNISWPDVDESATISFKSVPSEIPEKIQTLDEYDIAFCNSENIDQDKLLEAMKELNKQYKTHICNELKRVKPFRAKQPCDICGGSDSEQNPELITCTGCKITVHKECYGVGETPDPFWFCTKCLFPSYSGHCFLCDTKNGILKQTDDLRWVHVVCAVLNKSLYFANPSCKEPVDASALKKCSGLCQICNATSQHLIKCSYAGCKSKFHGSCAAENLYCDMNNKTIYCAKHGFNKKEMRLRSKRNMLKHRSSYPQLENDILIRVPCELQKPVETKFMYIIKTKPEMTVRKGSQPDSIVSYWSSKIECLGACFSDIFFYANYINDSKRLKHSKEAEN